MGKERRQHHRKSCVIPCDLEIDGKSISGSTRDVSMGGLSVQADVNVDQGDVLSLVLHPDRRQEIHIQAIVWHQRRVVQRNSKRELRRMGLVLSEAPDDFHELVGLDAKPPRRATQAAPKRPARKPVEATNPEPTPRAETSNRPRTQAIEPPASPGLPKPLRYRVRVTMTGAPRTRSILIFAGDEDEARSTAIEETGAGWEILEVEQA